MFRKQSTIFTLACGALVVGMAASTAAASGHSRGVPRAELQRALDGVVAAGAPGAIVLVRNGTETTRLTSGYANLAKKTPIRATDRFRIGSLTKTYVSTVVLQLVGEGKLSLNDSVGRWLPGLVPNGRNISIQRLLNMTSGLVDYLDGDDTIAKRVQAGDVTRRYTPQELVRLATAHKPKFAPGKGWLYCNTCYVLLGLVVEKATGHSIGAEIERRILKPLNLRHTTFDSEPRIAGRHSHGYYPLGKQLVDLSVLSPTIAWAAGGMVSTADDVERFYSALNGGRLLRPELLRAMRTVAPRSGGYGLGLAQAKLPCGTLWGNGGDFPGYNTTAYGSAALDRQYVLFLNLDEAAFTPKVRRALERVAGIASCGGR